jgi:hypothetical protein
MLAHVLVDGITYFFRFKEYGTHATSLVRLRLKNIWFTHVSPSPILSNRCFETRLKLNSLLTFAYMEKGRPWVCAEESRLSMFQIK